MLWKVCVVLSFFKLDDYVFFLEILQILHLQLFRLKFWIIYDKYVFLYNFLKYKFFRKLFP